MCGIAGFTGKPDPEQLSVMTRRLVHRGPDDEGFYAASGVNMGMRRLSIIDLETGHQPLHNEDETVWVTCNGEIYNFEGLRSQLAERGHRFYTHSDCEVLAHLYEQYDDDFLSHTNGMFAVALWDARRRRLVLARDRLGVKPLYYFFDGRDVYYASEIKGLLKIRGFEKRISWQGLSYYLTYRNVPAPFSIYEGIQSLLPGEMLTFESGRLEKKRYWRADFSSPQEASEEEAVETILALLKDAVRLRLISDVPLGAYLSGGVDSSFVVALMAEAAGRRIKTFSLAYADELDYKRDSHYARLVSERFGTKHHEYVMEAREVPENLAAIARHLEQPFAGVISTFFLSKLVREHVTVALTGDGADDQFGSYAHHRLCWPIDNYIRARRAALPDSAVDFRPYEGREDYVKSIAEDDLAAWRIKFYALTDEEKERLVSAETLPRLRPYASLDLLRAHMERTEGLDPLNRLLDHDLTTLLPDEILVFADRLSMAHSLELRSPFLDYRFVEAVAAMPGTIKIKDGVSKYILKKAAARYLPQEVLDRPKEGFILPQDTWMRTALKPFVRDLLAPSELARHGFFNAEAVGELVEGYFESRHHRVYKLWTLVMFQAWYEHCFSDPEF